MTCAARWVLTGVILLAGCGVLPPPAAAPAVHDFGPDPAMPAGPTTPVVAAAVTAPSWLAGTQIHYRLLYDEPTRLRAYAENRWIAAPSELMQLRLQQAFGNRLSIEPGAASQRYSLQVELLDFEQTFESAQSARVHLSAVATLRNAAGGPVLAQRLFTLTVPASPDVRGAVQGCAQAVDRLLVQVVQWTAGRLSAEAHGAATR